MQLFIADDLLGEARSHRRGYGYLRCDVVPGGAVIAREVIGTTVARATYPGLHATAEAIPGFKLPFVLAEPPETGSLWDLGPTEDLQALDLLETLWSDRGLRGHPPRYQPFIAAVLRRQQRELLLIGQRRLAFGWRRAASGYREYVWQRLPVTTMPPKLSRRGTSPYLRERSVAVVGVGSLGSRAADLLAAAGVGRLVLVDPDSLELDNVRRHTCGIEHLGRRKVSAVSDDLARHGYPTETVEVPARAQVECADEVRSLIADCDLALCCADSAAARQFVNHCAVASGRPAVIADVQLRPQPLAEVIAVVPGKGGCFNCWRLGMERRGLLQPSAAHDPRDYPDEAQGVPSGLPMYHLTMVAATACDLAGVALAKDAESVVWLEALDVPVEGFSDLKSRRPQIESFEQQSDCEVCRVR